MREIERPRSAQVAVALLLANLTGRALAVLAHQRVVMTDSLVMLLVSVLLAGLALGIAITPLPGGSEEVFTTRILKIALARLYALGALSLVSWLRRPNGDGRTVSPTRRNASGSPSAPGRRRRPY